MTLRRKNLLPHSPLVYTYGLMLVYGMLVACAEGQAFGSLHMTMTLAAVAALLRMGLGLNKYVVWSLTAALAHHARYTVMAPLRTSLLLFPEHPRGEEPADDVAAAYLAWGPRWPYANAVGIVALTLLGLYKINHPRKTRQQKQE